jgi:glycosyltransferase involved in cell wall biosynthesis
MRVALLLGSGNPSFGGVERHVIQLANGLIEGGHEAVVVMGHPCPVDAEHGLRTEAEQARVPVPDGRSFPRFARAALAEVRRRRPDVVHAHLTYALATGLLARARYRVPLVHTEHFLVRKSGDRGWRGLLGAALRGRADALIFVSRIVERECRVAGARPTRHVIYNGTIAPPRPACRRPSNRLLYVGRLEPDKRVEVILDVVRALHTEGYSADIVGTGSLQTRLQQSVADLVAAGAVRFHGWQQHVAPFLATAGALLQPAREGLGYAAIEAIAHGVPVLAPADSGAAEIIRLTGEGVVIDEDRRLDAWVAAARHLSALPDAAVELPGVFHLSHMLQATMAVYEGLRGEAPA